MTTSPSSPHDLIINSAPNYRFWFGFATNRAEFPTPLARLGSSALIVQMNINSSCADDSFLHCTLSMRPGDQKCNLQPLPGSTFQHVVSRASESCIQPWIRPNSGTSSCINSHTQSSKNELARPHPVVHHNVLPASSTTQASCGNEWSGFRGKDNHIVSFGEPCGWRCYSGCHAQETLSRE